MDIEELFKKDLLRKIVASQEKTDVSLITSAEKIEEAKKLFQDEYFNQVIVSAYTSMFHAARAILYKEGIQEKSHFAVFFYINNKFVNKIPKNLLISFDYYRTERHEALYGFEYHATKEDAEDFLDKIKEILNERF